MSFYDLGIKKPWRCIFQYPLVIIFLVDFCLTWRFYSRELRGDVATNISSGLTRMLGTLGAVLYWLKTIGRK